MAKKQTLAVVKETLAVGRPGSQNISLRATLKKGDQPLRILIRMDVSYHFQSSAVLELWSDGKWNNVVRLDPTEIPRFMKGVGLGTWEHRAEVGLRALRDEMIRVATEVLV